MPKTKSPQPQCTATKADGTPCRNSAKRGTTPPMCSSHLAQAARREAQAERRLTTVTNDAAPVPATEGSAGAEAPQAGDAPLDPGPRTIQEVIDDLAEKQGIVSRYIDNHAGKDGVNVPQIMESFVLHAMTASRLGRLLRDRRALSGDAADGIAGAIAQALDELSTELGADL